MSLNPPKAPVVTLSKKLYTHA